MFMYKVLMHDFYHYDFKRIRFIRSVIIQNVDTKKRVPICLFYILYPFFLSPLRNFK